MFLFKVQIKYKSQIGLYYLQCYKMKTASKRNDYFYGVMACEKRSKGFLRYYPKAASVDSISVNFTNKICELF